MFTVIRRHVTPEQAFQFMDKSHSDVVTFAAFKQGIAMLGIRPMPTEDELRILFNEFDTGGNGVLTFAAVMAALQMETFHSLEQDGSVHEWVWDSSPRLVSRPHRTRSAHKKGKRMVQEQESLHNTQQRRGVTYGAYLQPTFEIPEVQLRL